LVRAQNATVPDAPSHGLRSVSSSTRPVSPSKASPEPAWPAAHLTPPASVPLFIDPDPSRVAVPEPSLNRYAPTSPAGAPPVTVTKSILLLREPAALVIVSRPSVTDTVTVAANHRVEALGVPRTAGTPSTSIP